MIAGLVLAAGLSSRMAPHNKLLMRDEAGKAMVARVVSAVRASLVADVLVVTGHQAMQVERAAREGDGSCAVRFIHAASYAQGLSASLKAGIAALPAEAEAVLVCLGDMPLVGSALIDRLIGAYQAQPAPCIVVPTCNCKRGNPVLWDRAFFAEICALTGDTGARGLLKRHAARVTELETGDEAVLTDFDTAESLACRT